MIRACWRTYHKGTGFIYTGSGSWFSLSSHAFTWTPLHAKRPQFASNVQCKTRRRLLGIHVLATQIPPHQHTWDEPSPVFAGKEQTRSAFIWLSRVFRWFKRHSDHGLSMCFAVCKNILCSDVLSPRCKYFFPYNFFPNQREEPNKVTFHRQKRKFEAHLHESLSTQNLLFTIAHWPCKLTFLHRQFKFIIWHKSLHPRRSFS